MSFAYKYILRIHSFYYSKIKKLCHNFGENNLNSSTLLITIFNIKQLSFFLYFDTMKYLNKKPNCKL